MNCLDLFCGLGGFSSAFENSERWDVTTVDIEARFEPDRVADVFNLRPSDFGRDFDVVLASPPCTRLGKMAQMNGYFDGTEPQTQSAADHVTLAYHTLGLIRGLSPDYWFIENPQGKLHHFLGEPTGTVTYCQYGRAEMKRTHLWGRHPPMRYCSCVEGDDCHTNTPRSDERHPTDNGWSDDPAERAKVPAALSQQIRDACEAALDGQVAEQATLEETTP